MTLKKWPNNVDYATVIVHPDRFLGLPPLKLAQVARGGPWNRVLNWSGGNAVVFQLYQGRSTWAVRCFTRRLHDQQERYVAIESHMATQGRPDIFADCAYVPEGILIRGEWYPIVKMDWVAGDTLDVAIDKYIQQNDTQSILQLSNTWLNVIRTLQNCQIAHGDLQHDNIIVQNGNIRLVDYDGMYVPSLAGWESEEIGIEHYQHPQRDYDFFDANLDRFSALVIYLSLQAIATNPVLWLNYHRDKRLILSDEDYLSPNSSELIQQLLNSPSTIVRRLARELITASLGGVKDVPNLFDLLSKQNSSDSTQPRQKTTNIPDWLKQKPPTERVSETPLPEYLKLKAPTQRQQTAGRPEWAKEPDQSIAEPSSKKEDPSTQTRITSRPIPDWLKNAQDENKS